MLPNVENTHSIDAELGGQFQLSSWAKEKKKEGLRDNIPNFCVLLSI